MIVFKRWFYLPKKKVELSAVEVRKLSKPGRHAVGGVSGLLLVVQDSGSKSWILRTTVGGKRRNIGLGGFPEVSLQDARGKAREMKKSIEKGVDPVEEKRKAKRLLLKEQESAISFEEAAEQFFQKKRPEFKNPRYAQNWISSVISYANPIIGKKPVSEIDLQDVISVLKPIWYEKTETATRLRQRLEGILNWATVSGYRSGDNPARWKGHLDAVLSKPSRIRDTKHFPALPWKEIGRFMVELRKRKGMAARCLEFIILTACRSGEARFATWEEIDFDSKIWMIPGGRMKSGKEHRVPLSDDVFELLDSLPKFEGVSYLFPSSRGSTLSDMTISSVCKRMEINAVPHGFRSTFRDWCAESTNFPREVAELALAHSISNSVEAAYLRGDLLDKRRQLMDAWADFIRQPIEVGKIIPIQGAV